MARPQSARRLVDETWLRGSNGLLVVTRTRVRRDEGFQAAFRQTALALFSELWPVDPRLDDEAHLAAIHEDIGRMPLDLLDDLVDALLKLAEELGSVKSPANCAARLIAGWLRTRAVELRGKGKVVENAARLKEEYPELFREVLAVSEPAAMAAPSGGAARLY